MAEAARYSDIWYHSADGLRLYARDYHQSHSDTTILCMHGLTRNSADFETVCEALSEGYRLIAVDQRGRGRSEYASDPAQYGIETYANDMFSLLEHLQLEQVIVLGTSMGGLIGMVMTALRPELVRAVILNDVGPEINASGLARIQSYVGQMPPVTSWSEAAQQTRTLNESAFPDYTDAQWLRFARRLYTEQDGVPVLAYDPAIAQPMENAVDAVAPDLWPLYESLGALPMLLIRGEHSDILAPECVSRMQQIKPDLRCVEVPNRGHAPSLEEGIALAAIRDFLRECVSKF